MELAVPSIRVVVQAAIAEGITGEADGLMSDVRSEFAVGGVSIRRHPADVQTNSSDP